MGQFIFNLFLICIIFFQTVGEGTIWIINSIYKLIVWIIKHIRAVVSWIIKSIGAVVVRFGKIFRLLHIPSPNINLSMPRIKLPLPRRAKKKNKSRRYRKTSSTTTFRRAVWFAFGFMIAAIIIMAPVSIYMVKQELPHPHMLTTRSIPVTTKIYDRNGTLLYEIYADQNRTPVPLGEIPMDFVNATIAVEDKNFYHHSGYSIEGISRAAYATFFKDELQGGSTITQQLVRSALLNHEITLQRKVKELVLSIWSEQLYPKDEILEMYFNQVPYGGTAWGAEAAAQLYFGKSIRDVSLAEAALLAGLPAAPTTFSPFGSHPELALSRQKQVLVRMEEEGYITAEERLAAEEVKISYSTPNTGIKAPHFVMYVRDLLAQRYGMRAVEQGGLRVITSIDLELQSQIQDLVAEEVNKLSSLQVGNGAAVVTDPNTGEIIAMVGSTDYFNLDKEGNVNVALTPQQPGSTIKVVTYAAALQNGYTAATLINDSPITYAIPGSKPYSPVNYDGNFHGFVPLRQALGNSFNIPAVRALAKIGVPTMVEQGQLMGIESWDDSSYYGLSLALGGAEVTMLDMASVYNTLANEGVLQEITPILQVTDYMGNIMEDNRKKQGRRAVSEDVAYIISDILSDNNSRTTSFGLNSTLNIPDQWVAVKTGTSNEKRDNWAIGYTKDFVVTAWVGNNDNTPMHPTLTSGITGATPIWRSVTDLLLTRYPSTLKPSAPESVVVQKCRGREEYFTRGTETGACRPIPTPKPTGEEGEEKKDEA